MANKKGLSDVVSMVLVILLVLVAVGIIGTIVLKQVRDAGTRVDTKTACLGVSLTPVKCTFVDLVPTVLVSRGAESSSVSIPSMDIIFEDANGATEIKDSTNVPKALETSSLTTTALTKTPVRFTVSPTITSTDGKTNKCPASSTKVECKNNKGEGVGAQINIGSDASGPGSPGKITSLTIIQGGLNYKAGEIGTLVATSSSGATVDVCPNNRVEITAVDNTGKITGINTKNGGTGGTGCQEGTIMIFKYV